MPCPTPSAGTAATDPPGATGPATATAPSTVTELPVRRLSRSGPDMPVGRRRNRIDRSLRERGVPPEPQHREREVTETTGPWDEADAFDDGLARIDLGAIRIPALPGMDLRVELSQQQEVVGA